MIHSIIGVHPNQLQKNYRRRKEKKMMTTKADKPYITHEPICNEYTDVNEMTYHNLQHHSTDTTMELKNINIFLENDVKLQKSLYNRTVPYVSLCSISDESNGDCSYLKRIHQEHMTSSNQKLAINDDTWKTSNITMDNSNEQDDIVAFDDRHYCYESIQNISTTEDEYETISSDTDTISTHQESIMFRDNTTTEKSDKSSKKDDISDTEYDTDPSVEHILADIIPETDSMAQYVQQYIDDNPDLYDRYNIFQNFSSQETFEETERGKLWLETMEAYYEMLRAEENKDDTAEKQDSTQDTISQNKSTDEQEMNGFLSPQIEKEKTDEGI